MINGKLIVPPTLADALDYHRMDAAAQLRVAMPGEILTYDPAKRTAQIKVCYNRVYNDGSVKVITAPLVDVPVVTMQGGGIHFGAPIQTGDECLVIFADFNIDAWHANGGPQTPLDKRRHDISDGFAIVGPNSLGNKIETALGTVEGGISGVTAKVAINQITQRVTIDNGQNLKLILDDTIAQIMAVNAGIILDNAVIPNAAAAATAANTQLLLILVRLAALLY